MDKLKYKFSQLVNHSLLDRQWRAICSKKEKMDKTRGDDVLGSFYTKRRKKCKVTKQKTYQCNSKPAIWTI